MLKLEKFYKYFVHDCTTEPMATKLAMMVINLEGFVPIMLLDLLAMWSFENT